MNVLGGNQTRNTNEFTFAQQHQQRFTENGSPPTIGNKNNNTVSAGQTGGSTSIFKDATKSGDLSNGQCEGSAVLGTKNSERHHKQRKSSKEQLSRQRSSPNPSSVAVSNQQSLHDYGVEGSRHIKISKHSSHRSAVDCNNNYSQDKSSVPLSGFQIQHFETVRKEQLESQRAKQQ